MWGWLSTFTLGLVLLLSSAASATDLADFHPVAGPTTVDLGRDLASLSVGADYYFVDAANTKKLMQALATHQGVSRSAACRSRPRSGSSCSSTKKRAT